MTNGKSLIAVDANIPPENPRPAESPMSPMSAASAPVGESVASVPHARQVDPISPVAPAGTPDGTEAEPRKDDAPPTVGSRPDSIEIPVQASPANDPWGLPPEWRLGVVFTVDGVPKKETRTTIEIRKDLLREARARAERAGASLESIFDSALWEVLGRSRRHDERFPGQDGMPTYGEWRGWYNVEERPKSHYDETIERADEARSPATGVDPPDKNATPGRARATVDIRDFLLMESRLLAKLRGLQLRDLVEEGLEAHLRQSDSGDGPSRRPVLTRDGAPKSHTRTTVAIRKDLTRGAQARAEHGGVAVESVFEEALRDVLGRPGRESELLSRYLNGSTDEFDWRRKYEEEETPKLSYDETAESDDGTSASTSGATSEKRAGGLRARATVDIRDDLLIEARYLARRRRSKLRDVIEDGLEEVLKWPLPDPTAEAGRDEGRVSAPSANGAVSRPREGIDFFLYGVRNGFVKITTRTTVDIGEDLLRRVRDYAERRAITLRDLVDQTLREVLARPGRRSELVPAEGGDGVPSEREWFRRYVAEEMPKPRFDEPEQPGRNGGFRLAGTEASGRASAGLHRFLTVNIEDFVLMRARNLARRRRASLGAVIADGLEEHLNCMEPGGARGVYKDPIEDPHNPERTIYVTVSQQRALLTDASLRYEDVDVDIDED